MTCPQTTLCLSDAATHLVSKLSKNFHFSSAKKQSNLTCIWELLVPTFKGSLEEFLKKTVLMKKKVKLITKKLMMR